MGDKTIKDFKEAIVALCAVAVFGIDFAKTKHLDFAKFMVLLPKMQDAIGDYNQIIPQALDMDSAEAAEVVTAVAAELQIENEKAKKVIIASIKLIAPVMELVSAVKS